MHTFEISCSRFPVLKRGSAIALGRGCPQDYENKSNLKKKLKNKQTFFYPEYSRAISKNSLKRLKRKFASIFSGYSLENKLASIKKKLAAHMHTRVVHDTEQ
jgi:hypothetical protein